VGQMIKQHLIATPQPVRRFRRQLSQKRQLEYHRRIGPVDPEPGTKSPSRDGWQFECYTEERIFGTSSNVSGVLSGKRSNGLSDADRLTHCWLGSLEVSYP